MTEPTATSEPVGISVPAGSNRRSRWLGLAVLLVATGFGVWAVVRERDEIVTALGHLHWWTVPLSFAAGLAGLLAIFRSWAVVVADGGTELQLWQARRIYGVGQVGKYIPGSVWSVVAQAQMVREYGGSRAKMASASLVALLISVTVALGLGCALLPFSGHEALRRFWFAPVATLGLAVVLAPAVLNGVTARVNRVLRRPAAPERYTGGGVLRSVAWIVLGNLLFGLHLFLLGAPLGLSGVRGYLLAVCAYALAAGLGVLAVLAPAGAGVRELVITVVLAPELDVASALTVALLSRVVTTAVDLALAFSQLRVSDRDHRRRPVFVTRRFPPSIGGMETLAAGVWRSIEQVRPDAVLLAHGGSNLALLWWLPVTWLRLAVLVLRGRADFVLAGDAFTGAWVHPLLRLGAVPQVTMILGLDVTYAHPVYRRLVHPPLRHARSVIAISSATRDAAVSIGVRPERVEILRLGVETPAVRAGDRTATRNAVRELLGLGDDVQVLLTLGRLVRRKGAWWFVRNVLPQLPPQVHYVVAGDGPDRESIEAAVREAGVTERVHLTGSVSEADRETLMRGCDVFVQPNIAVPGDMEGFGLVAVEAAMRGTVVIAADLEGLKDAVLPGETGLLVASEDAAAWVRTIGSVLGAPEELDALADRFRAAAIGTYGEEAMGRELCRQLGLLDQPTDHPGAEVADRRT